MISKSLKNIQKLEWFAIVSILNMISSRILPTGRIRDFFKKRESKERLTARIKELNREIFDLNAKLSSLNEQKEGWFKKKEELKQQISKLVNEIKDVKIQKDTLNDNVKNLKSQRDMYNAEVKKLIYKIKELGSQRETALKKCDNKSDFIGLREKIDSLESKIETDALSFKEEQKIMKQIKKLKESYSQYSDLVKVVEKINETSNAIEESKRKAEEAHKKMGESVKLNFERYGEFIADSKKIIWLRDEQEKAFQAFLQSKNNFAFVNNKLKEKLIEANRLQQELNESERREREKQISLMDIKAKVEEKLKRKEKLTTEDIISFQGGKDDS